MTHQEADEDGWFNFPELLAHLHGASSKSQKAYCNKVWANAQNKPRRPHPDGPALPEQRKCFAAGREKRMRARVEHTSTELEGEIDDSTSLQQMMELLGRPRPLPAREAAASGSGSRQPLPALADGDSAGDGEEAHEEEPEALPRADLYGEIHKAMKVLLSLKDAAAKDVDGHGELCRKRTDDRIKELNKHLEHLQKCEVLEVPKAHEIKGSVAAISAWGQKMQKVFA